MVLETNIGDIYIYILYYIISYHIILYYIILYSLHMCMYMQVNCNPKIQYKPICGISTSITTIKISGFTEAILCKGGADPRNH